MGRIASDGFRAFSLAIVLAWGSWVAPVAAGVAPAASKGAAAVAGVYPDRRPAGAPSVVAAPAHDAVWQQRALYGIEPPYPESLRFLDDQGSWYTPFVAPGMTGPYDIRGWHRAAAPGAGG
jgi:hypothetical protein